MNGGLDIEENRVCIKSRDINRDAKCLSKINTKLNPTLTSVSSKLENSSPKNSFHTGLFHTSRFYFGQLVGRKFRQISREWRKRTYENFRSISQSLKN